MVKAIYTSQGLVFIGCLFAAAISHAANLYEFKDKDGNVLLTNVIGANKKPKGDQFKDYSTRVKVTWYADTNVHTYKNWGSTEASVLPSYSKSKNNYDSLIQQASGKYGIEAALIKAIMHTESGFNPNARSPVGAQGLMQLMPATARRFSVNDAFNPEQNIMGATRYLNFLTKRFGSDLKLAIAAYNAGEGNVDKYGGIPPFRETQDYVKRVLSRYKNLYEGKHLSLGQSLSLNQNSSNHQTTTALPQAKIQYITQRPALVFDGTTTYNNQDNHSSEILSP